MCASPLLKREFRRIPRSELAIGDLVHKESRVYKATWTRPESGEETTVAAKLVETIREKSLDIIWSVHHNNVLKFYGTVLQDPAQPDLQNIIITEFCSEGSLYDVLGDEKRVIDFKQKQDWALGIARGMSYLHDSVLSADRAIRHNNLSSANVFMKVEGGKLIPKIGGFEYSKEYSATGSVKSTKTGLITDYAWQAPERIEQKSSTPKSDVYSYSIVLWHIYTRKVPYKDEKVWKIMRDVTEGKRPLEEEFVKDKSFPEDWKILITECWDQDPEKRPSFDDIVYRLRHHPFHSQRSINAVQFTSSQSKSPLLKRQAATAPDHRPAWQIDESNIDTTSDGRKCPREGRFGCVTFATYNGKPIALRFLQPQCVKSFKEYMGLVTGLPKKCPFLVDIIGGCECENPLLFKIAMERMETALLDKIQKGVISDNEVYKKIALDVAHGLHYLHDLQPPYFHGSFTSANVLLRVEKCPDSTKAALKGSKIIHEGFVVDESLIEPDSSYIVLAKVSDFCCNVLHDEIGSAPSIVAYRAPESGATKSYSTKNQDVFAYGVMMLDMRITQDRTRQVSMGRLNRDSALGSFKTSFSGYPKLYNLVRDCTDSNPDVRRALMKKVVETFELLQFIEH